MKDEKYHIKYSIEPSPDGFTADELTGEYEGACDCIVVGSIVGQPLKDEPVSHLFIGFDGFHNELMTPNQMFQAWSVWARALSDDLPDGWRKRICDAAFESTREMVLSAKLGAK